MKKIISITAILLGTSGLAQAGAELAPSINKNLTEPTKTSRPLSIINENTKLLVSTLEDHSLSQPKQTKLNASCN
ncbi:hypothetical protein J3P96_04310 [Pseudomonas sp. R3-56]|uniref:hypothetical protein n=1 Tax=Pseudomonas sp. R3-56 TaxID=2817401 RepID=UPI003DA803CF